MWPVRVVLVILAIALIAAGPKTRKAAIFALAGVLLANFSCDLLKNHVPVNRPCVDMADVINHGVGFLTSKGTASAHAANTAAIAFAFTYFLRWWGVIPILLSFFTGIARIYVGVHYPSQVLYGWIVGAAVGALLIYSYRFYESRKQAKPEKVISDK
ncbi:MAG TPA: phosphatase PAP2 family protein [Fimbriimonadaceae bacterium]|jgi:undecaprenyl-diphosphatase